jgi:hypothetical protein
MKKRIMHGSALRGLTTNPQSSSYEGMFGRMFRTILPADHNPADLIKLGQLMVAPKEDPPAGEDELDGEENLAIDAGYTYLGQFIDHDITFDPSSSLQKQNDPNGIVDFRTPRFDLDNIYGRGPDDQPYLYKDKSHKMLLGRPLTGGSSGARDLTRLNPANTTHADMPKRALIGDPRNDENVIISQLQGMFIRFHNKIVDILGEDVSFAEIQQEVRWHYQWVVLHDFLPTIVGQDKIYEILPHLKSAKSTIYEMKPRINFYHWRNSIYMPVEFSVGAYRFGHSMIRPIYRLNANIPRFPIFDFKNTANSLLGFRDFPDNWAINWDLFFSGKSVSVSGINRIHKSYKIDTSLVDPLGHLPATIAGHKVPSLAERNLLRGLSMGLSSGQNVARHMGITPIADKNLKIGKAADGEQQLDLIKEIPSFADNAPLWYYILAEAQHFNNGKCLGPVGGTIVAEVFIGMLLGDSHSFLSLYPNWKPRKEFLNEKTKKFGIRELIDQAISAKE